MAEVTFHEKYQTLIDAEIWAFIKRTNGWFLPDAVALAVAEQRESYAAMCGDFYTGRPDGVKVTDRIIRSNGHDIAIRSYVPDEIEPKAHVLYAHGGGYILGNLDSHDDVCAEICARTGYGLVSVDYRLSPEHAHPAAYDDVMAGYIWLAQETELPIVMAGDSAGACLVASVSHGLRNHNSPPAGQLLIYPTLGGDHTTGSYIEHANAPLLDIDSVVYYEGIRQGEHDLSRDVSHAPLNDTDYSGLPPTLIISAECDPLSDDGRNYRDRIAAHGGKAHWINEPGLVHGYLRARHSSKRAADSFTRIVEGTGELGRGEWNH